MTSRAARATKPCATSLRAARRGPRWSATPPPPPHSTSRSTSLSTSRSTSHSTSRHRKVPTLQSGGLAAGPRYSAHTCPNLLHDSFESKPPTCAKATYMCLYRPLLVDRSDILNIGNSHSKSKPLLTSREMSSLSLLGVDSVESCIKWGLLVAAIRITLSHHTHQLQVMISIKIASHSPVYQSIEKTHLRMGLNHNLFIGLKCLV